MFINVKYIQHRHWMGFKLALTCSKNLIYLIQSLGVHCAGIIVYTIQYASILEFLDAQASLAPTHVSPSIRR